MDNFSEFSLVVNRCSPENFWSSAIAFYKGALGKPEKLKRSLVVSFDGHGEEGYDAGALKKEFFEDCLKAVNERLFEGNMYRTIPRKDVSMETLFEVAGMMISHSVLQEGPAMSLLSPFVFDYILHGDISKCHPLMEDIPLNMFTCELISAIEKVSSIHDVIVMLNYNYVHFIFDKYSSMKQI